MRIVATTKKGDRVEIAAEAPDWNMGEHLISRILRAGMAQILSKFEGPDARRWILLLQDKRVVVDQWDTGDLSVFVPAEEEALVNCLSELIQQV